MFHCLYLPNDCFKKMYHFIMLHNLLHYKSKVLREKCGLAIFVKFDSAYLLPSWWIKGVRCIKSTQLISFEFKNS